ncbi:uncharacterized protein VTP21DRAFT_438 [Calcarisporiella thermophila]|uniref:uncharacterized protein n=1 Tax=Calcarisporiella thermophila TaxID=911321 RepID=UPI0037449EE4
MLTSSALRIPRQWVVPKPWLKHHTSLPLLSRAFSISPCSLNQDTPARRSRKRHLPLHSWLKTPSAEEAVNNILYNTPTQTEVESRHVLNCLVENEPGVLSRVSGVLAARGFNIDSLVVANTEVKQLSRMTIVLNGKGGIVEQARRQLEDLVPVWAVLDYSRTKLVERELLLIKVSILGPEYLHEQMGDQHLPTSSQEENPDMASQHEWEKEMKTQAPSEVLHQTFSHLRAITELTRLFDGRVVDVSSDSLIAELCAKSSRVDSFIKLLRPFGIIECARSGVMAMPRSPVHERYEPQEDHAETEEEAEIDATMLPPG